MAAYLGNGAADLVVQPELIGEFYAVLDEQGGPVEETLNVFEHPPTGSLAAWSAVLPTESADFCTRVALAACRAAANQHQGMAWAEEVLIAIEDYLLGPRTPEDLETLGNYWWTHTRNGQPGDPSTSRTQAFGWAITNAQILASYDPEGAGDPPEEEEEFDEWRAEWADNRPFLGDVLAGAQHTLGPDGEVAVAEAIQAEVTPWLLGSRDPVRERVEAREAASD